MKLLTKDNKLYVYDEFSDKYYTIAEDDIEFIIDESETTPDGKPKLLPDEQVRRYLEDKYFPKKKTKAQLQGFYSKKVNLKKQVADVQTEIYNNALLQKLFKEVNEYENSHPTVKLSSTDRLKLIKKPTLNTIKSLSIPSELESLLETAYNEFKEKNTVDIDRGNENSIMSVLPDLLDIFVNNNNPQVFTSALKKRFLDLFNKYQETVDILTHPDLYDRIDVEKANKKIKKLVPQLKKIKEDIGKTPIIDTNSVQLNNRVDTMITQAEDFMKQIEAIKNRTHVPTVDVKLKDVDKSETMNTSEVRNNHEDKEDKEDTSEDFLNDFDFNYDKENTNDGNDKVSMETVKTRLNQMSQNVDYDILDTFLQPNEEEQWNNWKQDMPYDLKKLDRILDWFVVNNKTQTPDFKIDENNKNELKFHLSSSDGEPIYNVHVINTDDNEIGKIYFDKLSKIDNNDKLIRNINSIKKNLIDKQDPKDIKLQVKVVPINPDGKEELDKITEQRKKFVESELNKDLFDNTLISDQDFYTYLLNQNKNTKLVPWGNVKMQYKPLDYLSYDIGRYNQDTPLNFMYRNLQSVSNIPRVNKNFATEENYKKFSKDDKKAIFAHDLYQYTPEEIDNILAEFKKSNINFMSDVVKALITKLRQRKSKIGTNYPNFYKQLYNEVYNAPNGELTGELFDIFDGMKQKKARAIPIPIGEYNENNVRYKKAKDINNPTYGDVDPTVFDDYISTMGFGNGSIAQLLAAKLNSKFNKFKPRHHDPINMSVMLSKKLNSPK